MERFTWLPAPGARCSEKPTVDPIKFGDGYEQRVGRGINADPCKWALKFTRYVPEVLAFLKRHGGRTSFIWTDPLGVSSVFICREWSVGHLGGNVFDLTCEFEEVFE